MNLLGMANLCAMGISPKAQLLVAQIFAVVDGFGQTDLGLGGGLGGFAGMQQGNTGRWSWSRRTGSVRRPLTGRQRQERLIMHHHPTQEETTAAAVRRKAKKISNLQY